MPQTKIQSVQLSASGAVPGSYTNADVTVDSAGRITAVASGTAGSSGTVTSITVAGTAGRVTSTGSPITTTGTVTLDLATTTVTPGTYTASDITVDAYGRITAAANGSSGSAAPLNEVVLGTGPGIGSSVDFTFDPTTGELNVNQNLGYSLTPGDITIGASSSDGTGDIQGGNMRLYSGGSSGFQTPGEIRFQTGTSADNANVARMLMTRPISNLHASNVEIIAGSGITTADGGHVTIGAGRAGGDPGTLGGVVEIFGGNGHEGGGSVYFSAGEGRSGIPKTGPGGAAYIQGGNGTQGGDVTFFAGAGTTLAGGHAWIAGGGSSSPTEPAGNVYIESGTSPDMALSGVIRFTTQIGIVLDILGSGDFQFSGSSGTAGQVITSAGPGFPPTWATVGGTPSLTDKQIAYGSPLNVITSTADFTYDDTTGTMGVGPTGSPALVTANTGQSITVEGDTGAQLKSGANTFGINSSGAVLANASAGTVGQVLTSGGAAAAPTWTTVGGGTSAPLNQLVYGTGPGTSSSPDFTFNSTTGELNVNQTLGYSLTPGNVTIGASSSDGTGNIAGGDVSVYSGSASGFQTPGKILLETGTSADNASRAKLLLTRPISSNHASSIEMYAARGNTSADGGYVSIRGGRAGGDIGTLGGVVEIYAGDGYLSGLGGSIRFSTQVGLVLEILNTGDLQVGGSSGTVGQVLTSAGSGSPATWQTPAGGGVQMNVYYMTGGTGDFSGTIINNWAAVQQKDENATTTWGNYDSYAGSFECLVNGVYEIVVECQMAGSDGSPSFAWPDELTAYGVDLPVTGALMDMPQTKSHTRYSPPGSFPNLNGNFGLSQLSSPAGESGTKVSFTERYIVRSNPGGLVYPRLFAASYASSSPTVNCSMTISFMKISGYTPA